jgi:hypothetical protein
MLMCTPKKIMEMSIFCKYAAPSDQDDHQQQSSLVMSNIGMLQSELLTQEVLPAAERRAMRREAGHAAILGCRAAAVQSSESLAVHWIASLFFSLFGDQHKAV